MGKKLKVLIYSMDGIGHINACIGLGQAMAQRGHQIFFMAGEVFRGNLVRFGFNEIILVRRKKLDPHACYGSAHKRIGERVLNSPILSNLPPLEKLKTFKSINMFKEGCEQTIETHDQMVEAIKRVKPDLIVVDHYMMPPCIAFGIIPWAYLFSGNPAFMYNSPSLPPLMSGLPSSDQSAWEEHRKVFDEVFQSQARELQNKINRHFGCPDVEETAFLPLSPFLNIYGFPEELDYTDLVPMPANFARVDAFNRELPDKFDLPPQVKSMLRPGDKLIYVSMGTMGSVEVNLMKRIVSALSKTPHKYIVSKGPLWREYELSSNMWGEPHLPQTSILPLVDLVITHGGNNTITEAFCCGKPLIVLPLFADQFDNAQRVHEKEFGVRLDTFNFQEHELIDAVDGLLNDQNLRKRLDAAMRRIREENSKEKLCIELEDLVPPAFD